MSQKMEISCILDSMSNDYVYLGMIEASKRGARNIIIHDDIKIISDDVEGALYIVCDDIDVFKNNRFDIDYKDYYFVNVYNKDVCDYLKNEYPFFKESSTFYICTYLKKEKFNLEYTDFRNLDKSYYDIIRDNYELLSNEEIKERLFSNKIFGLFVENELVGFIGIHKEGDMGIFKVFDDEKFDEYAYALEANLINYLLDENVIIYTHIQSEDERILKIQEKLGLKKSDSLQYWLYAKEEY